MFRSHERARQHLCASRTRSNIKTISHTFLHVPRPPFIAEQTLDRSILAPLLSMSCLETLDITSMPIALVPIDIKPMARAWPQMRCLRLHNAQLRGERLTKYLRNIYCRSRTLPRASDVRPTDLHPTDVRSRDRRARSSSRSWRNFVSPRSARCSPRTRWTSSRRFSHVQW